MTGDTLRLTVLMTDAPYPANHGGRVDRWDRLRGLARLGVRVQLVIWTGGTVPSADALAVLRERCSDLITVRRERRLLSFLRFHPPGRLDSYVPDARRLRELESAVVTFGPHWILADGIETSLTARLLSERSGARLAYRSQNVEHLYWRFQRRLARGIEKVPFLLAEPGMERAERALRSAADLVLDISEDDLSWWRARTDVSNALVLPPTFIRNASAPESDAPDIDVSFSGGLYAPNNVQGVEWYLVHVAPLVSATLGRKPVTVVAGAAPTPHVRALCRRAGVQCIADPPSLDEIRNRSRVLVNPVLHSSGVNLKMLEMFATGRPVIATAAGSRGLPPSITAEITVRSDAETFARAVVDALSSRPHRDAARHLDLLDRACGLWRLSQVVERMATAKS